MGGVQNKWISNQIENLHKVCVEQRNGVDDVMMFTTSTGHDESHGFYYVKFGHVMSLDTMLFMEIKIKTEIL